MSKELEKGLDPEKGLEGETETVQNYRYCRVCGDMMPKDVVGKDGVCAVCRKD